MKKINLLFAILLLLTDESSRADFSARPRPISEITFVYSVEDSNATLIQIARGLYKDERRWKEIATLNKLRPPYKLSFKMKLRVLKPDVPPLTSAEVRALTSVQAGASVRQDIRESKEGPSILLYVVNERAPSLSMISRELYGDLSMVSKIAQWNGLTVRSNLALGQVLKIKARPKKSVREADQILIEEWRKRDNENMVYRISKQQGYETQTKLPLALPSKPASQEMTPPPPEPIRMPADEKEKRPPSSPSRNEERYWFGDFGRDLLERIQRKIQKYTE